MIHGLIVDSFAGGGGASTGIEMAFGRSPDIAVNHDPEALAMHAANHPDTEHYESDVWAVDPVQATRGEPVAFAWFSPDCKDFSKAKGGRPIRRHIRDLAWIAVKWARTVRPQVIALENVEEFQEWGPLREDGSRCPGRKGQTFRHWVQSLQRLGYKVDWWVLRGCDYGAPTIRKRLVLVARCDGGPVTKPEPTHGSPDDPRVIAGELKPYRTAANIIDWSIPCPSIFMTREEARELRRTTGILCNRPLADNTMKRIAKGVVRYVLENPDPFIVSVAHGYSGGRREYPMSDPLGTVTKSPQHAVVAPFLAQHNTGVVGHDARKPVSTIVQRATTQAVVAPYLLNLKGSDRRASSAGEPHPTICAGGGHAAQVSAFLVKYYGTAVGQHLSEPLHTATSKARFGLVTVSIAGEPYVLVDIGMRMLTPRELFRAQGFPDDYDITTGPNDKPLTLTAQRRMCGNSVCPDLAAAVARANVPTGRRVVAPVETEQLEFGTVA